MFFQKSLKIFLLLVAFFSLTLSLAAEDEKVELDDDFIDRLLEGQNFDDEEEDFTADMDTFESFASYFFNEIYDGEEKTDSSLVFKQKNIPADKIEKWKNDANFWYLNHEEKESELILPPKQTGNSFWTWLIYFIVSIIRSPITKAMVWIAAGIAFVAIVLWLLKIDIRLLLPRKHKADTDVAPIDDTSHTFETLQSLLNNALQQNNRSEATRLMLIVVIKSFDEKKIINYKKSATNAQYVMQLSGSNYYTDFFHLSRIFDYVTYGHFNINEEQFARAQQHFMNLQEISAT